MDFSEKYKRNHYINGVYHPVGTLPKRDLPDDYDCSPFPKNEEEAHETDCYNRAWSDFTSDENTYRRLLSVWNKNPNTWFTASIGPVDEAGFIQIHIEGLVFETKVRMEELASYRQFPKSAKITAMMRKSLPEEYIWTWRVRFSMEVGVLVVADLRGLTASLDRLFIDYKDKQAVSKAIAMESSSGDYFIKFDWFRYVRSQKSGKWLLLLPYEVISGKPRGYQGAMFFDLEAEWGRNKFMEFLKWMRAVPEAEWKRKHLMDLLKTKHRDQDWVHGLPNFFGYYGKGLLDFSGDYVNIKTISEVSREEVAEWL